MSLDGDARVKGPLAEYLSAKKYLQENCVTDMFRSVLAALMLERPNDHLQFVDTKFEQIKELGRENVRLETFVHELHPDRNPVRRALLGSDLDKESSTEVAVDDENVEVEAGDQYKPQVFQLTETVD